MSNAYKNLGTAILKLGNNRDTAIYFYNKCFKLAKQSKDYYEQAACLNNLGYSYRIGLQYDKSIKTYLNALDVHSNHLPVDRLRMLIIGNIGDKHS